MVDGGTTLNKYTHGATKAEWSFPVVLSALCNLLESGIVPLNNAGILHFDIKSDNVVFDGHNARLIDWDAMEFISSINPSSSTESLSTFINRPLAYSFHARVFPQILKDNENLNNEDFAEAVVDECVPWHRNLELHLGDKFGVNIDNAFLKAQVLAVLQKFRTQKAGQWTWDANGFTRLLHHNTDVYGWLSVVADIVVEADSFFRDSDIAMLSDDTVKNRFTNFFLKYFYNPDVLAEMYNIPEILREVRSMIELFNQPPAKRRRVG